MGTIDFQLTALSPLDGRYGSTTSLLAPHISEFALIRTRIEIEITYLMHLSKLGIVRKLNKKEEKLLWSLTENFKIDDAKIVKEIEKTTRHDVKAVEMFLRSKLQKSTLKDCTEMIHFGLTSEDVNNLAYRLMLIRSTQKIVLPSIKEVINELVVKADAYKKLVMLGRTHGQSAIPTTLGKELIIFANRLSIQYEKLKNQRLSGKLNGAIGNYSSLQFSYPKINWIKENKSYIDSLGLVPNIVSNQINPYDDISEYLQIYIRLNSVLLDLDQDMWRYVSDGWFVQEVKKGEVGSSTMPQKVNPIDFENSEGNLGLANALLDFMSRKLPISRLQRDLSDSTVVRNIATVLGYSYTGYKSTHRGLLRVKVDERQINDDLVQDWSILTEAVQTLFRKDKIPNAYDMVKQLVRGKQIGKGDWSYWVHSLRVDKKLKSTLINLSPYTYIGNAVEITNLSIREIKKRL